MEIYMNDKIAYAVLMYRATEANLKDAIARRQTYINNGDTGSDAYWGVDYVIRQLETNLQARAATIGHELAKQIEHISKDKLRDCAYAADYIPF